MATLIVSENATLDGAVLDPTGEEGAPRGGWFARAGSTDRAAFAQAALEEALAADAFLMGRRTYAFLAARWPARTGPLADRLNRIPKFVVSSTLGDSVWDHTTVIRGEAVAEVKALKQRTDGEIVVPASFQLVRTLFAHDLVDQLRVTVYPVVLGAGEPWFGRLVEQVHLGLLDSRTLGDHLTQSTYEIKR